MTDRVGGLPSEIDGVVEGGPLAGSSAGHGAAAVGRLRRGLSPFAVLLLTLSCLSPVVSIFGVGGDVLRQAGTGAGGLFLLGIAAAVVWGVVYAELGSAYPYAGGDYVAVGSILGGGAGMLVLALWASTAAPSIAFSAQIIANYCAELAPGVPAPVFTFGSLVAAVLVALLAVRTSAVVTGIFLAIEMAAVAALIGLGAQAPARGLDALLLHPVTATAGHGLAPVSLGVMALAAVSAVYATVGGNQALVFGEEMRDPHRRMGGVVICACLIGAFCTALPVVFVAASAPNLAAILASPAPFAAFVDQATAAPWAAKALSAGVALAVFNANIVAIMAFARLYFSLGRDGLFTPAVNRALTDVGPASGVPRVATVVIGLFSTACAFLSSHVLLVFFTGLLVYGWTLVCVAVLVGRRRGLTGGPGYWRSPLFPLAPVVGLAMAAVFTLADLMDADAGRPSLILLGAVLAVTWLWYRFGLRRRPGGWKPTLPG